MFITLELCRTSHRAPQVRIDTQLEMTQTSNRQQAFATQPIESTQAVVLQMAGAQDSIITVDSLRNSSIGAGLRDDQLEVLANQAELRRFQPREAIVTQNDTSFPVMVLITGYAEVLGLFGDVVNVIQPGGLIGEVSFLDGKPRSADVLCRNSCQVAVFSKEVIAWLDMERPDILSQLLYSIGRELCLKLRTAQRVIDAADAPGTGVGTLLPNGARICGAMLE